MHFTTLDYFRFGVILGNPPETPDYLLVMAEIEIFVCLMWIRVAPVIFNKPFVRTWVHFDLPAGS